MSPYFGALDNLIVLLYLVAVITIGGYFYRGQLNLKDYFLAGRSMNWMVVTLSIFATGFSAVGFIGSPGVAFKENLLLLTAMFNMPLVALIILYVLMPFFYNLRLYTPYEYLERRFDLKTRTLASGLFLLMRGFLIATGMYATAILISETLGTNLVATCLGLGIVATVYTVLGGIKAVMINDNLHFFIINTGAVIAFVIILSNIDGGISTVYREATASGHLRLFDWSFNLYGTAYDSWNCIFGLFFANLVLFGVDQTVMQRNLTSRTNEDNRRAIIFTPIVCVPLSALFYFLGTALYVYYLQHPAQVDPDIAGDRVFIHYILTSMPAGLKGLLVVSIFAAALSTIDSALNSLSTVTSIDFVKRFRQGAADEEPSIGWARVLTLLWGILGTGLAGFWAATGGLSSVLESSINILSFYGGPLLGIFLAGMLFRRFTANGAFFGSLAGFSILCWSFFLPKAVEAYEWDLPGWILLTGGIHIFWFGALGLLATWIVGGAVSLLGKAPTRDKLRSLVIGDLPVETEPALPAIGSLEATANPKPGRRQFKNSRRFP